MSIKYLFVKRLHIVETKESKDKKMVILTYIFLREDLYSVRNIIKKNI